MSYTARKHVENGWKRPKTRERRIINIQRILLTVALCAGATFVSAPAARNRPTPLSNTTVNQRDRDPNQATADQQKNNPPDRELTKDIRKSIMADKSLSTYARDRHVKRAGQIRR